VAGQITLSLVLLTTAALFLRNLTRAANTNTGFDTKHTLWAHVTLVRERYTPESRAVFLHAVIDRLRAMPGVESAAYATAVPLTMYSGSTRGGDAEIEGRGGRFHARFEYSLVSPRYFATMGIPLRQGREFLETDRPGAPAVAIVNDEFVRRYLPGVNPIGQRLSLYARRGPPATEIVGIVANSKHRMIGEEQQAAVYEPYLQTDRDQSVQILVRTAGSPGDAVAAAKQAIGGLDSTAAVDVRTMERALTFAFLPSRIAAAVLGSLGLLGLVLAMVGLYATVNYAVSRRTAEVGIRMALGATPRSVARLVLRDVVVVVGAGTIVGLLLALVVTRPLAMFLVAGLSASDPLSYAGTALALGTVAIAAALPPAWRASRIDPAAALRCE
jgi:predicted permease